MRDEWTRADAMLQQKRGKLYYSRREELHARDNETNLLPGTKEGPRLEGNRRHDLGGADRHLELHSDGLCLNKCE